MEMIKIYIMGMIITAIIVCSVCKNTQDDVKAIMVITWPIFWLHFLYCLTKQQ